MSPFKMSKIESVIRLVLEFNQAFNNQDITGMMELLDNNCTIETADPAPGGTVYSGVEEISQYYMDLFAESSKVTIKIEDIFGLGERCIMRWKYNQEGDTGTDDQLQGVDIFKVRSGAILEIYSYVKG